jgi:predicted GNAT family acetyltransferase
MLVDGGAADAWLRHALRVGGVSGFLGAFDERGVLCGAALLRSGALCAARLSTPAAVDALVPALRRRGTWFSVVGPEEPCARLVSGLAGRARLRVNRLQVLMTVSDASRLGPASERLRPARPDELDTLLPVVTAYRREDGLTAPGENPSDWLRTHLADRIDRGNVHVIDEGGEVVFTGAFNFRGSDGAGLGGIYTAPAWRGRGVAARGTAALCRIGLSEGPVVTLHVDARNAPALRCYENAGLEREGEFRLTFR